MNISDPEQPLCVALAEYSGSCSNVFIERIFVFFMILFLKKMGMQAIPKVQATPTVIPDSVNRF